MSETGSDALPAKPSTEGRKRAPPYPDDFEQFWAAYPTDPNMSKKQAATVWKRLSPEDREAAQRSLPAFIAYCRGQPTYRPVHACRYLSHERWRGHLQVAETAEKFSQSKVFVEKGSPQWKAWQSVKRTTSTMSDEHRAEGWWFPSEWPPAPAEAGAE